MTMKTLTVAVTGNNPLLQNNPQTVDRFNEYAQSMAVINKKGKRRTDDDYRQLQDIEVRSKIYWDDEMGIYVPSTWLLAGVAANAFKTVKVSKADIRGAVFSTAPKLKLTYRDQEKVKEPIDIVNNHDFRIKLTLKQGQARIVKAAPIFHNWSFSATMEFDDKVIDPQSMVRVIEHTAKYSGFGDFRPTFGRATAEVTIV